MEVRNVRFFSDDEEMFTDLLCQAGLTMNSAKVLVFLARARTASSRDIEHGTDLRQSEISIALKNLNARGWIGMKEQQKPGPERKIHILRLTVPLKKIIADIEHEQKEMIGQTLARIKQLRKFAE